MTRNPIDQGCRVVVLLAALLLPFFGGWTAPSLAQEKDESEKTTYRLKEHPDLGVSYEKVARFKLATRKKEYQVGETVVLAFAMLNITDTPTFFLQPERPDFSFKIGTDTEQRLPVFALVHLAVLADNFELLEPGETVRGSMLLLAGCPGNNKSATSAGTKNSNLQIDERNVFERGQFGDLEQGCIPFSNSGAYTITAEFANGSIVWDRKHLGTKTAVGTIQSEPLTIRITDK